MTAGAGSRPSTPFHLDYGPHIEAEIDTLVQLIGRSLSLTRPYAPRWLAIKLLEGEPDIVADVQAFDEGPPVISAATECRSRLEIAYGDSADIAVADARYGVAHDLVRQVLDSSRASPDSRTDRLDTILTNRWLGLPIFFGVMFLMFKLVVEVSSFYVEWIDAAISGPMTRWIAALLGLLPAPAWFDSLIAEGVLAGVGAVLVFLPGLLVLYFFLTLLEDTGYMARVAFLMDRAMRFTGLHGKSFVPMILGFGCAVPAIYSTRTLENRRQRIATSLLVPLMSCSARLPVYVVFGLAFFSADSSILITALYLLGIAVATVVGLVLSRTLLRDGGDSLFTLELPPYRLPALRAIAARSWQRSREFLVKAGTVILVASVALWFLTNLPWGVEEPRDSYFGQVSAAMVPAFEPAGFGTWEATAALVGGFVAKEVVVSTLAQTYLGAGVGDGAVSPPSVAQDVIGMATGFAVATDRAVRSTLSIVPGIDLMPAQNPQQATSLSSALASAFTPLSALAFVVFVLIYTPCVATLSAMRSEYGWRWAGLSAGYQLALAWLVAVVVFRMGTLLGMG